MTRSHDQLIRINGHKISNYINYIDSNSLQKCIDFLLFSVFGKVLEKPYFHMIPLAFHNFAIGNDFPIFRMARFQHLSKLEMDRNNIMLLAMHITY